MFLRIRSNKNSPPTCQVPIIPTLLYRIQVETTHRGVGITNKHCTDSFLDHKGKSESQSNEQREVKREREREQKSKQDGTKAQLLREQIQQKRHKN